MNTQWINDFHRNVPEKETYGQQKKRLSDEFKALANQMVVDNEGVMTIFDRYMLYMKAKSEPVRQERLRNDLAYAENITERQRASSDEKEQKLGKSMLDHNRNLANINFMYGRWLDDKKSEMAFRQIMQNEIDRRDGRHTDPNIFQPIGLFQHQLPIDYYVFPQPGQDHEPFLARDFGPHQNVDPNNVIDNNFDFERNWSFDEERQYKDSDRLFPPNRNDIDVDNNSPEFLNDELNEAIENDRRRRGSGRLQSQGEGDAVSYPDGYCTCEESKKGRFPNRRLPQRLAQRRQQPYLDKHYEANDQRYEDDNYAPEASPQEANRLDEQYEDDNYAPDRRRQDDQDKDDNNAPERRRQEDQYQEDNYAPQRTRQSTDRYFDDQYEDNNYAPERPRQKTDPGYCMCEVTTPKKTTRRMRSSGKSPKKSRKPLKEHTSKFEEEIRIDIDSKGQPQPVIHIRTKSPQGLPKRDRQSTPQRSRAEKNSKAKKNEVVRREPQQRGTARPSNPQNPRATPSNRGQPEEVPMNREDYDPNNDEAFYEEPEQEADNRPNYARAERPNSHQPEAPSNRNDRKSKPPQSRTYDMEGNLMYEPANNNHYPDASPSTGHLNTDFQSTASAVRPNLSRLSFNATNFGKRMAVNDVNDMVALQRQAFYSGFEYAWHATGGGLNREQEFFMVRSKFGGKSSALPNGSSTPIGEHEFAGVNADSRMPSSIHIEVSPPS